MCAYQHTHAWVQERGRPEMAAFLSLFEHKARENSKLNRQEVHAITAFLVGRVREFARFEGAQSQLRQLLVQSAVLDVDDSDSDDAATSEWSVDSGELINRIREVRPPCTCMRCMHHMDVLGLCAGNSQIIQQSALAVHTRRLQYAPKRC